jgi:predicted nucleic acid-binding protein
MRKPDLVAVLDSTALIDLARVNLLEVLSRAFQEVYIPESVFQEVVIKGKGKTGSREVSRASFLIRKRVQSAAEVELLQGPLSQADAEVIVLAKEIPADVILTRDTRLRRRARQEKLSVVLTGKFYVQLKAHGLIESVKAILDEMQAKGVKIRQTLYEELLREASER